MICTSRVPAHDFGNTQYVPSILDLIHIFAEENLQFVVDSNIILNVTRIGF